MSKLDYESPEPRGPRLWPGPVVVAILLAVMLSLGWLFYVLLE